MKKLFKFLLAFIFLGLIGISQIVFADEVKEGLLSYQAGEYDTAYRLLSPLAIEGNPAVQAILGIMFEQGQGVPKSYKEAVKWYQLSAES